MKVVVKVSGFDDEDELEYILMESKSLRELPKSFLCN